MWRCLRRRRAGVLGGGAAGSAAGRRSGIGGVGPREARARRKAAGRGFRRGLRLHAERGGLGQLARRGGYLRLGCAGRGGRQPRARVDAVSADEQGPWGGGGGWRLLLRRRLHAPRTASGAR